MLVNKTLINIVNPQSMNKIKNVTTSVQKNNYINRAHTVFAIVSPC